MTAALRRVEAVEEGRLDGPALDAVLAELTAEFAAGAAAHDRDGSFPFENFSSLHAKGLLGLTVGPAWGGAGADLATTLKVVRAVAKGDPATALVLVMQYLFHASVDQRGVSDALYGRVARDAVENGALINALRVEPDLGTLARGGLPATVARRTADGWSISGHKLYSTGIPALTWLVVWARTDEAEPRVGGFLVHRDSPGIQVVETWDHLGLRASGSHDVILTDVPTPLDHALDLRKPGELSPRDAVFGAWAAVLTAGIYDAVAEAARDWLIDFARRRVPSNLGAALSTLPRFQEAVGTINGLLLSNRALLAAATRGETTTAEAGLVKHLVTENAIQAVETAVRLTGNPGITRHNPLERHYRDVLCGRIHTPQADVVLVGAGRAAFAAATPS
ncbi:MULTISPECIES: acyl-CoA dehydrogenase family protein [Nitrospirillum]|uniref:Alkylation response protein AidB-like acyl-CoA dehydrogenase n=1 Tax=Nitrospirillum amazonense TaxID=28077 RepID=A0A560F586_9PROT|nr:acyl-CoA dehydrogenase family protein [Nitrospirillum amazonense]MEC4589930.1 acyl-CoA dehydrogenase family protein [Nitrospirillum amazonense]TWB16780.1 alkylation response protein AidB-like acyl-CoA dehydrogenase [Nitrospirillum amazonense]